MEFPTGADVSKNFIPVQSTLNWDEYFMLQAMLAGLRSKDPNTKVGTVFVDSHNHQLSMGYNGQVAGINEDVIPWGNDRSEPYIYQKYGYVVHAEANAILHSKTNLNGSRCYVTLFPCNECAKMLSTLRVQEVVYLSDKYAGTEDNLISKKILSLAQVKFRQLAMSEHLLEDLNTHLKKCLNHT